MLERKLIEIDGKAGITLPDEVVESLQVQIGDFVYLAEMLDGTYRLARHDDHQVEQMELVEGGMHEEDA